MSVRSRALSSAPLVALISEAREGIFVAFMCSRVSFLGQVVSTLAALTTSDRLEEAMQDPSA
jgi:hypothetical protein